MTYRVNQTQRRTHRATCDILPGVMSKSVSQSFLDVSLCFSSRPITAFAFSFSIACFADSNRTTRAENARYA